MGAAEKPFGDLFGDMPNASGAWPVLDVLKGLSVRVVRPMPPLSPAVERQVGRLWQEACQMRPLFNGQVFCADSVGPDIITGHWTEYRRVVAQMADPALIPILRVRSLAVCGAVTGPGGVAVARRDARSVYQAGLWQLPPAGSVDGGSADGAGADIRHALLAELREELGVAAGAVRSLRPLCLVQHPSGVLDLGIQVSVAMDQADLLAAHRVGGNDEYDRLLVVPPASVPAAVRAAGGTLVPSALAFLGRLS
jgi:8-oxo-dGTP pyrophosphatase MutT (NUDIX family)